MGLDLAAEVLKRNSVANSYRRSGSSAIGFRRFGLLGLFSTCDRLFYLGRSFRDGALLFSGRRRRRLHSLAFAQFDGHFEMVIELGMLRGRS